MIQKRCTCVSHDCTYECGAAIGKGEKNWWIAAYEQVKAPGPKALLEVEGQLSHLITHEDIEFEKAVFLMEDMMRIFRDCKSKGGRDAQRQAL